MASTAECYSAVFLYKKEVGMRLDVTWQNVLWSYMFCASRKGGTVGGGWV